MKVVWWIVGVLLILRGIAGLSEGGPAFGFVVAIACGILMLPVIFRRLPLPTWTLALVLIAGLAGAGFTDKREPAAPSQVSNELIVQSDTESDSLEQAEERTQKIKHDLETAYIPARSAIRRNLKDPDSFEEIGHKTRHVNANGVYLSCLIRYRAKNSFNGYSIEQAVVNFNHQMEPVSIEPVE